MKYPVAIEKGPNNHAAYVPGLPICVATGGTGYEVARNIREAMESDLWGIREDGLSITEPRTTAAAP